MMPILPPGWEWVANGQAYMDNLRMYAPGDDLEERTKAAWEHWEKHSGITRAEWEDHLTFQQLRKANVARCDSGVFNHTLQEWTPEQYGCAMAGEVGEALNKLKKMFRGLSEDKDVDTMDIGIEIADAVTYADLFAARLGLPDLGTLVRMKFNIVSDKRDSDIML